MTVTEQLSAMLDGLDTRAAGYLSSNSAASDFASVGADNILQGWTEEKNR